MNKSVLFGSFLIIIGFIFLFDSLGFIEGDIWEIIWPIFLLIPALFFHYSFFSGRVKNAGILVPGGIMLVLSGLFFFHTLTGWGSSEYTWPFYLYAVAFGLFELYIFGERERGLLVPIIILAGIGLIFTLENIVIFPVGKMWPILLIILGFSILIRRRW